MTKKPRRSAKSPPDATADQTSPESLDTVRRKILEDMVAKAETLGWGAAGLRASAKAHGFDEGQLKRAFPRGIPDLLVRYCRDGDRKMEEALSNQDLSAMRVPEKIALAVRARLEAVAGEREAVKRATTHLSLPLNAAFATEALYNTVDAIWRATGDTSEGTAFYTKRLTLAGVYSSTLLVWLGDKSEGYADTWRFLDDRLGDVATFGKVSSSVRGLVGQLPGLFEQWRSGGR